VHVVNAYTQYDYRGAGVRADYDAIKSCMMWIKRTYEGKRIGLPLIGAGLAKGDWATIEHIIASELHGEDVKIVKFAPTGS
jgi:O-acetyl-ADP-ribose deacetylase (regulator of RNase III)